MRITFKELSELTGIAEKSLHAYASPSKKHRIIKDDEKMFDTDIIKNDEFLKQAMAKKEQKIRDDAEVKEEEVDVSTLRRSDLGKDADKIIKQAKEKKIVVKVDTKPKAKQAKSKEPVKDTKETLARKKEIELANENKRKKDALEIAKLEKDNRLKQLEIEKKEGDFISMQEAMSIARDWAIEKDRIMLELMQKEIVRICSREAIPTDRAGKYKMKISEIINKASEEATNKLREYDKS